MPTAQSTATFQAESLSQALWDELMPLLKRHYEEIAPWKDVPLSPDYGRYEALDSIGALKIHTARDASWALIGYHASIVMRGLHYSTVIMAQQDVLWVAPEHRHSRIGSDLLLYAESFLKKNGVNILIQHTKITPGHDLGPYLMRRGYEPLDMLYAKRLDT